MTRSTGSKSTRRKNTPARKSARKHSATLSLILHRRWFDDIASGKKTIEYRDNTAYWRSRLLGHTFSEVHFRNGYAKRAPFMRVEFVRLRKRGIGRKSYFAIRLGKILQLKNYK